MATKLSIERLENNFFTNYPVQCFSLKNGLDVLIQENHDLPIISMFTLFSTGSRNERPGITGISHLFEHMMFNGSKKFGPKQFDLILESGGGYSNAYTSRDFTVYYEEFRSSLLKTVIELESDRMGWLDLSEESLRSEREVVKEERRFRTEDSIFGRLDEELYAASFQCHPYRWPVIGWMSDIENISLQDCKNYFKQYYAPNNALIVLSGDLDPAEVKDLIEEYYSCIPKRKTPPTPATIEPEQKGEKIHHYRKKSEISSAVLGYHVPQAGDSDVYALDVLQTILTDGQSSLLHKKLVREKEIALNITSEFTWHIDPGIYILSIQMKPGYSSQEGERAIEEEIVRMSESGFTNDDLKRAINILYADFVHGLQTNNGRAHRFGLADIMLGGYKNMFVPLKEYKKVTLEDVSRVLDKYFRKDNKTAVRLIAGEK